MNKTVLVTGSSRGIGRAIAQKFSAGGYNVALNCMRSTALMDDVAAELKKSNPNILGIQADVGNFHEVACMFEQIYNAFGGVDVLVNNAGIAYSGLFQDMKPSDWEEIMNVNFFSVMNCSHAALGHMLRNKNGSIVNISSIWGEAGASCEAVYSASKGAINAFTRALAKELAPGGVRINAVSCGVIDTEMNGFLSPDEIRMLTDGIPLGRLGTTAEIAELVFFLASPEASYITGQIVRADGGML